MKKKTFEVTLSHKEMGAIPVPFDPKEVFGKARAPVKVTLNGYSYRSTVSVMDGVPWVPLRKSHREAAGLEGDETLRVILELDEATREVTPPEDMAKALKRVKGAWARWGELSFTHQREYAEAVEGAKKPETRLRRIEKAVAAIAARAPKRR
jgi:hypothetical protein